MRADERPGPGPYVFDPEHAQRIDDLALYIQQQHYEEDLAEIGDDALRRRLPVRPSGIYG